MIKWILCACCFHSLWAWAENPSPYNELSAIEQQIHVLKERWHQINLLEMKEEVKGQGLMIADWEAYSQELQLIRQQEHEDHQIELKIKKLEERKAELLKKQQQTI
jgi:hypothetical protein